MANKQVNEPPKYLTTEQCEYLFHAITDKKGLKNRTTPELYDSFVRTIDTKEMGVVLKYITIEQLKSFLCTFMDEKQANEAFQRIFAEKVRYLELDKHEITEQIKSLGNAAMCDKQANDAMDRIFEEHFGHLKKRFDDPV